MRVAGIAVVCVLLASVLLAAGWWKRTQRNAREAAESHSMWVDGFSAEYQLNDLKEPGKRITDASSPTC